MRVRPRDRYTLRIETTEAYEPFLQPSRYKGAWGGRGSGKSHFFAERIIVRCMEFPGTRVVCIREVQKDLTQSVKLLIEDKIKTFGVGHYFRILNNQIETPGGGLIIFQGMQNHTAESIKSLEGFDIAWVEEAQSLSQRSLDLLRPTIRKPNSEIWFTWNPRNQTDPVDVLLRSVDPETGKEILPPDAIVCRVNYQDNRYFPDILRTELEWDKTRDIDKYKHVWLGEYNEISAATVFRNWREGILDIPDEVRPLFGADWGFAIDPTTGVRCWLLNERLLYIDREVYEVGCEIDATPALFDKLNDTRIPNVRKWPMRGDSARPETISYMNRQGFTLVPATKGAGSVDEGVAFLKSIDIVVHPDCKHVINELVYYSYKQDPLTLKVLPVLADKKNHCLTGDTLVETVDGPVRIDALVGMSGELKSFDPVAGEYCTKPFSDVRKTREDAEIVRVEMEDGRHIDLTEDHLVLTLRGWIEAGKLSETDEIIDFREVAPIRSARVKGVRRLGRADVYNLEVEDTHCFAVNGGLIVHNCIDAIRYALEDHRKSLHGIIEYARLEAAKAVAGMIGRGKPPELPSTTNGGVKMKAPNGISTAYGMMGTQYNADADGIIVVSADDVGPLRAAGFLQVG